MAIPFVVAALILWLLFLFARFLLEGFARYHADL